MYPVFYGKNKIIFISAFGKIELFDLETQNQSTLTTDFKMDDTKIFAATLGKCIIKN